MIALFIATGTGRSFAEVQLDLKSPIFPSLFVYGTISKGADYVAQHEADFRGHRLWVYLNSVGGDVAAAMKIGRIIRNNEAALIETQDNAKCFSSCGLDLYRGRLAT
jgi:ATP-dependent protease ClpP protease subunit